VYEALDHTNLAVTLDLYFNKEKKKKKKRKNVFASCTSWQHHLKFVFGFCFSFPTRR
jgi:hypothetical protein